MILFSKKNNDNKKPVYFIVEGETDVAILNPVFNKAIGDRYNCKFMPAFGYSNIISRTKAIIDLTADDVKIIVLYDSDENDLEKAQKKLNLTRNLLDYESYSSRLYIGYFHQNIEIALIPEQMRQRASSSRGAFRAYIQTHINEWIDNILTKEPILKVLSFINN